MIWSTPLGYPPPGWVPPRLGTPPAGVPPRQGVPPSWGTPPGWGTPRQGVPPPPTGGGGRYAFLRSRRRTFLFIFRISRTCLYKGLNDSQRQPNSNLAQLGEHETEDLVV